MNFRFSPEDDAFRAEIRAFLEAEWPGGTGDASVDSDEEYEVERAFERKLAERGWLTMAWPEEYGGTGATNVRQAIMKEECTYFRAPYGGGPGAQATGLVGPTLMVHGTDEQKRRFLPPIARGEHYWCQGFSRAGRRLRPRVAADARRARRRRLRDQRPEDLDLGRAVRRLDAPARAHRPRRAEAQGHHLLPRST